MRPLFFLIALGTTALTIAACKKPEAEVAPAADANTTASTAPPQEATAPPAPMPPESTPPIGATTVPEGGTTTPQGGPPPVSPPQ